MMAVAFAILVASAPGTAQENYITIADGPWSSTAIWSYDGYDPCDCSPPVNISSTEVTIKHEVTAGSNIHVKSEGTLIIDIDGALLMPDKELNVQNGTLYTFGFMHLGAFDVGSAGYAMLGAPAVIEDKFLILGTVDLHFSTYDTLKIMAADMHINPGAVFNAVDACVTVFDGDVDNSGECSFDNASICSYTGDIVNKGTMSFEGNTCATGYEGDFINKGSVSGNGAGAINVGGMVDNDQGDWTGVLWCATSGSEGMTGSEDCSGADSICALTGAEFPLAIDGIQLATKQRQSGVEVSWIVTGEYNIETYAVQRAGKDRNFAPIAWLQPTEGAYYHKQYSYIDRMPVPGLLYYRISVEDEEGSVEYSNVSSVAYEVDGTIGLHVFPNPLTTSEVSVTVYGIDVPLSGTLAIYSPDGRLVNQQTVSIGPGEVIRMTIENRLSGPYVVRFISGNKNLYTVLLVTETAPTYN